MQFLEYVTKHKTKNSPYFTYTNNYGTTTTVCQKSAAKKKKIFNFANSMVCNVNNGWNLLLY
jgi:hypothetical protein